MSIRRSYRSPLREQRALETRRRILVAARDQFEEEGFSATTIASIARRARVSEQTIYGVFGSKKAIVAAMMDELELLAGGEEAGETVLSAANAREQLDAFIHFIRTLFEQGAPILRAAMAARGDEEVRGFADTGNQRRLEGVRMLTAGWQAAGALRTGLSAETSAQTLWLLTSAETYFLAIDSLGWTADAYEAWLRETARYQLLAPQE